MHVESMSASDAGEQSFGHRVPDIFRLTVRALCGQWLATPKRLAGLDVLVVSPGGVGTTFLINHLARFAKTNDNADADYLKHLPAPPRGAPRTIFIRGDEESIYASIKRRRWVGRQGAKLGSLLCVYLRGRAQKAAFIDAVRAQEARWRRSKTNVLFVHYDDIWRRAEEIMIFAGVTDPRFLSEFPQRQSRLSAPPHALHECA